MNWETMLLWTVTITLGVASILGIVLAAEGIIVLVALYQRWRERRNHDRIMKRDSVTDD